MKGIVSSKNTYRLITDKYGNILSTQYRGGVCRCPMCGRKNADSNKVRNSYLRVGLAKDESGTIYGAKNKKNSRKLRRVREKRLWMNEW